MLTLEERILARHNTTRGEWATFTELGNGTGSNYGRSIDVAAFNLWPSKHFYRVAYEVKRSRGDFLRELAQPDKRHWVEQIFHETWFVFGDKTIAAVDEIPDGWGLMVASGETRLRRLRVARVREAPNELPASVTLAVLRRAQALSESGSEHVRLAGRRVTLDELDELVDASTESNLGWERSRLETSTKNREAQRERLRERQRDLEEPLAALSRAAGGSFSQGWGRPAPADVDRWIEQIRTGVNPEAVRCAGEAKRAVDRLMEVLK